MRHQDSLAVAFKAMCCYRADRGKESQKGLEGADIEPPHVVAAVT